MSKKNTKAFGYFPIKTLLRVFTGSYFLEIKKIENNTQKSKPQKFLLLSYVPAGNYIFKVNNRNTRTRCEICSELTIKTPERYLASFWCLYC